MSGRHVWLRVLLAVFLVALFPPCFYGALQRAQLINNVGNLPEEEHHREDHSKLTAHAPLAARTRAPAPSGGDSKATAPLVRPAPAAAPARYVTRYIPHPSRFSERRLI
jgi:hypothetical protein